jgi:cell division protein FtsQ
MPERRLRPLARRGLIAAAAIGIVACLAYGSTYTWLFAADAVHVEGSPRMSESDVRRLAGIDVGANVFHLDTAAVERRLLGDPRVAAAHVLADLPDAVTIRIVERIPVASAELDGATVVVADDGAVLPDASGASLPQIRPIAGELDEARRVGAAAALAALAPSVRRNVVTVFSAGDGELVLETVDGVTVTYGSAVDVAAKAASLRAVLAWAGGEAIELTAIDVTVANAPTARTANGTVTPR